MDIIISQIEELLPQLQCQECGYKDCLTYANAIFKGDSHNKCLPGGTEVRFQLSTLLKLPMIESYHKKKYIPSFAIIDENKCIGCGRCAIVCPTDAIIGTRKHMYTVIKNDCTGCKLCIPICPVDCITSSHISKNHIKLSKIYKNKYEKKLSRINKSNELIKKKYSVSLEDKKNIIAEAIKRIKIKKKKII
jgi:electron transport complex protein RnfB